VCMLELSSHVNSVKNNFKASKTKKSKNLLFVFASRHKISVIFYLLPKTLVVFTVYLQKIKIKHMLMDRGNCKKRQVMAPEWSVQRLRQFSFPIENKFFQSNQNKSNYSRSSIWRKQVLNYVYLLSVVSLK
jgi:hypothetical protein